MLFWDWLTMRLALLRQIYKRHERPLRNLQISFKLPKT